MKKLFALLACLFSLTASAGTDLVSCRLESVVGLSGVVTQVNGPAFSVILTQTNAGLMVDPQGGQPLLMTVQDSVGDWAVWYANKQLDVWLSDVKIADASTTGYRVRRVHVGEVRGAGSIWNRIPNEAVYFCR